MNKKNHTKAIGRREFLHTGTLAALSLPLINSYNPQIGENSYAESLQKVKPEWRNKQDGMVYRQLGRTGFMVSELVYGTERNSPDNTRPVELAFEKESIISIQHLHTTEVLQKQHWQRFLTRLPKGIRFSLQQRSLLSTQQETGSTGRYLISSPPLVRRR